MAATLHTQVADEAGDPNVTFLRDSLESLDQAAEGANQPPSRHRSRIDSRRDPRRLNAQPTQPSTENTIVASMPSSDALDDRSRRERLQRVLARLNRLHDPTGSSTTAYSNRTPSPYRQSLYDWAPSHEEQGQQESGLAQLLNELRRQHPDTHPDLLRLLSQSELLGGPGEQDAGVVVSTPPTDPAWRNDRLERQRERERERERRRREREREPEWGNLRSRAVLQRARQEGSPAATERMLRYVMDRERSGMSEEEDRARWSGWFRPNPDRYGPHESWPLPPTAGEFQARTAQARAELSQPRRATQETVPTRPPRMSTPPAALEPRSRGSSSAFLENTLSYLNDLRYCYRYTDALSAVCDYRLVTKDVLTEDHDDFIVDLGELGPLAQSSWLQPGAVFEGHQRATNGTAHLSRQRAGSSSVHSVEQINPNYTNSGATSTNFDHPPGSTRLTPFDATRPWLSHQFTPPTSSGAAKPSTTAHDRWPVRVVIHAIDPEKMVLQGTMEAYDVPQHPAGVSILHSADRPKAGKKHAPITTYLEGHIIDLATHSFLTPSAADTKRGGPHPTNARNSTPYTLFSDAIAFPAADANTDAANWRKLPPFDRLPSDNEAARCMLSKTRMTAICEEYIFMRWKERCFVHGKDDKCSEPDRAGDQDRGHGLTISGFYYVSLRRSDGAVEGLYFDPTSTPYQQLKLQAHRDGWPAVEFR